jgi:hypothetical protein
MCVREGTRARGQWKGSADGWGARVHSGAGLHDDASPRALSFANVLPLSSPSPLPSSVRACGVGSLSTDGPAGSPQQPKTHRDSDGHSGNAKATTERTTGGRGTKA